MLTKNKLKTNDSLQDLTDEQLGAIVRLSEIDEEYTLKKHIGDIHSMYDKAVSEVLGVIKPKGLKTYKWLKCDVFPMIKNIIKANI